MSKQKVLYWDIETLPMEAYVFRPGKQVVSPDAIKAGEQIKIACICALDVDTKEKFEFRIDLKKMCDKKLLKEFTKVANGYDVTIGHNLERFDVKHLRTRIAMHRLDDCKWAEGPIYDTLAQYRRSFAFPSNRLDYIAQTLEIGKKSPMSLQDWIGVKNGCKKSLDKMVKYCHNDVKIGAKVYKRLLPFIKVTEKERKTALLKREKITCCERCGSKNYVKQGFYTYKSNHFQRYLCKDCYKIFPSAKSQR